MRRWLEVVAAVAALGIASVASATPSNTFWTPATIHTQAAGLPHLTYDTYFGERGALQIDVGLTVGVLSLPMLLAEVGVDLFFPTATPSGQFGTLDFAQVNGRVTLPERALGVWSPGFSVGVSNVGFKSDVSNYHMVHATFGRTTRVGRFGLGGYYGAGSRHLWQVDDDQERAGLMASWVSREIEIGAPGLDGIMFLADLATGRNWFGGGGVAVGLLFTPSVRVVTGPVVVRDWDFYERAGLPVWLWSVQLDVDVDLVKRGE